MQGKKGIPKKAAFRFFRAMRVDRFLGQSGPRVAYRGPNLPKLSKITQSGPKVYSPSIALRNLFFFGNLIHLVTTNKNNTCSPVERTSTSDKSLSRKFPYGSPRRYGLHIFVISCQIFLNRVCMTQCKINITFQSQKPPHFKVVLEW